MMSVCCQHGIINKDCTSFLALYFAESYVILNTIKNNQRFDFRVIAIL